MLRLYQMFIYCTISVSAAVWPDAGCSLAGNPGTSFTARQNCVSEARVSRRTRRYMATPTQSSAHVEITKITYKMMMVTAL